MLLSRYRLIGNVPIEVTATICTMNLPALGKAWIWYSVLLG
ncbi:MAG: hypothetical protein ROM54_10850 [Anaerobiospirillum sp.]|nr:hypothetical protein [Anaerobiospirillum sp.]